MINLSVDKAAVLTEMDRELRQGGRVGVRDVVAEDRLTPEERAERGSYVGCVAGALSKGENVEGLTRPASTMCQSSSHTRSPTGCTARS